MEKITRINSRLYYDLFSSDESGDRVISVFLHLKNIRGNSPYIASYKAKNNKFVSGYSLLRAKSNITLSTLKKYVPILIDKGLVRFDEVGNVFILGGDKINTLYSTEKVVPIKIGKNLIETAYNSYFVRIHASHRQQRKQIAKKQSQKELLLQVVSPKSSSEYKKALSLKKRLEKTGKIIEITDMPILSREGFSKLKFKKDTTKIVSKSSGFYYKKVLKSRGKITTKRRFEKVMPMSYLEYRNCKNYYNNSSYTYINGYLSIELISSFNIKN